MRRFKKILRMLARFAPLFLCLGLMGGYLLSGEDVSVDALKSIAPAAPILAMGFLVALYAFKSLTVVFPIIVLNVLGGFLFSPAQALLVNCVGVAVELTIPYWIGRLSGADLVHRLEAKYPRFDRLLGENAENQFFLSFFLRVIFCLPGDLVSMYFGAVSMPFWGYLAGSFLGMLPGTVAATLLGMSITDPASPLFWVSVGLTVGLSVLSVVVYGLWKNREKKRCTAGRY